jgi:DNA-binding beta-propeller fold protein YncE
VAVDPRTRRVFIANDGHKGGTGSVSVLDEASGAVLRSVAAGQNPTAVTVDESTARVFVIKNDGVGVLDARTGTLLRTVPVSIISSPTVTIDERRGRAFVASAYFNMLGQPIPGVNLVSVLDATSGALLRRIPVLHGPIAVAVDDRSGRVFSANLDGTASMLDPGTGAVVRTVSRAPAAIGNAVAVDSQTGRVFVSDYNPDGPHGHVSVLDAGSGALLQTIAVGNEPYAVAVAERTGHVFILSASGVSMLDARSGRVLHSIKLVANSVVVDERTNRVFVSDANGMVDLIDARSGAIVHTPAIG